MSRHLFRDLLDDGYSLAPGKSNPLEDRSRDEDLAPPHADEGWCKWGLWTQRLRPPSVLINDGAAPSPTCTSRRRGRG